MAKAKKKSSKSSTAKLERDINQALQHIESIREDLAEQEAKLAELFARLQQSDAADEPKANDTAGATDQSGPTTGDAAPEIVADPPASQPEVAPKPARPARKRPVKAPAAPAASE